MGGCRLRKVLAREGSTLLTKTTFLTLNISCSVCSSKPSRLKTRSSTKDNLHAQLSTSCCFNYQLFMLFLFALQREEAIRKNHVVTSGGDGVANTWKVERPKSLDVTQDTSYFLAKTLVCYYVFLPVAWLLVVLLCEESKHSWNDYHDFRSRT